MDLSPDLLLSLLRSDLLRLLLRLLLRPPPPLGDPVLLRDSGKPPPERERLREADPRSDILALRQWGHTGRGGEVEGTKQEPKV